MTWTDSSGNVAGKYSVQSVTRTFKGKTETFFQVTNLLVSNSPVLGWRWDLSYSLAYKIVNGILTCLDPLVCG